MSDHFLRIIPADAEAVPPSARRKAALTVLRALVPDADEVTATVHDEIAFIDAGDLQGEVRCPFCKVSLDEPWTEWMDRAAAGGFAARTEVLPCCARTAALEDLVYDGPIGFARFELEARNQGIRGRLADAEVAKVEQALGCSVRQILAHY